MTAGEIKAREANPERSKHSSLRHDNRGDELDDDRRSPVVSGVRACDRTPGYRRWRVRADVLVLDACMAQCDEEDLRLIGNIRHVLQIELNRMGLIASVRDALQHLDGKVPLPPVADPHLSSAELTKELKDGISRWTGGDHEEAAQLLRAALARATENPAG